MVLTILFACNVVLAQKSGVKIRVKWPSKLYENKIEVYNTSDDILFAICDNTQRYIPRQGVISTAEAFGCRYNLGCVTKGNNYCIKIYNIANTDNDLV